MKTKISLVALSFQMLFSVQAAPQEQWSQMVKDAQSSIQGSNRDARSMVVSDPTLILTGSGVAVAGVAELVRRKAKKANMPRLKKMATSFEVMGAAVSIGTGTLTATTYSTNRNTKGRLTAQFSGVGEKITAGIMETFADAELDYQAQKDFQSVGLEEDLPHGTYEFLQDVASDEDVADALEELCENLHELYVDQAPKAKSDANAWAIYFQKNYAKNPKLWQEKCQVAMRKRLTNLADAEDSKAAAARQKEVDPDADRYLEGLPEH